MQATVFLAVALVLLSGAWAFAGASEKISEQTAVEQVKRATGSAMDSALPSRAFGAWVTEKFEGWDVQWELHDCGAGEFASAGKERKRDSATDTPVCVQVNIMQPAQKIHGDSSNGFHLLFQVGTERKGFLPTPRVRTAIRKDGDEVQSLKGLAEVEP